MQTYSRSTSWIDSGYTSWFFVSLRAWRSLSSSRKVLNHSLYSLSSLICCDEVSERKPHEDGVVEFLGYTRTVGTLRNLVSIHVDGDLCSKRGIGTHVTVKYLVFHSARSSRPFLQPTNVFLSSRDVAECDAGTCAKDERRLYN
jgi:hypothetical protein